MEIQAVLQPLITEKKYLVNGIIVPNNFDKCLIC